MSSIPKGADVAEDHIPWNKGRLIGPKPPLKLRTGSGRAKRSLAGQKATFSRAAIGHGPLVYLV